MNKSIIILALLYFCTFSLSAQGDWCLTEGTGFTSYAAAPAGLNPSANEYEIRIYTHIVRKSNGTMGVTTAKVNSSITRLVADFAPYGICFSVAGNDYINDDDFVISWSDDCINGAALSSTDDNDSEELISLNSHSDGIDIYFLPDNGSFQSAYANGIPGSAIILGGESSVELEYHRELHTLSHEMGHALGLFHTYFGTAEDEIGISCTSVICELCPELVNGDANNRNNCGDFVSDTPADPFLFPISTYYNSNNCTVTNNTIKDTNGDYYLPDPENFMGFVWDDCRSQFTPGQVDRMKNILASHPILSPVVISNSCTQIVQRQFKEEPKFLSTFNNSEWISLNPIGPEGLVPYKITEQRDTFIDGKSYKIFSEEIISVDGINPIPYYNPRFVRNYYIREDLNEGKVWELLLNVNGNNEILILDYSLQTGDSHPTFVSNWVVSKVDTITLLDNIPRKRIIFSTEGYGADVHWVEGVGSLSSPFEKHTGFMPKSGDRFISGVICHSQNGNLVYNDGAIRAKVSTPCSNLISVPTKTWSIINPDLKVFPNPARDELLISSELLFQKNFTLEIYALSGKKIAPLIINSGTRNIRLDLKDLLPGLYFVKIKNSEGVQSASFVKQ